MSTITFSEQEISSLFGHEAAEDEAPERLRAYYFKSATYGQIVNDVPFRILVGHKGIGKSALFQIAISEDQEKGNLAIQVRPDDVIGLAENASDFLKAIREWKVGLQELIAQKVLNHFGHGSDDLVAKLKRYGGKAIDFLQATFKQVPHTDLGPARSLVYKTFLKDSKINVYIDDLDRGWQGRPNDIQRISALLNAVRDLVRENPGIRFRVGMRSDVYYLVRTSDESTDKVEGSVIWQSWTNHEILVLLVKRIESFYGRQTDEQQLLSSNQGLLSTYLNPVFEDRFQGRGQWESAPIYRVLMSLTRKRPRDLVKLCTLAARQAGEAGHSRIKTADLEAVFEEYSQGRLQDTVNEFRSELPDLERLLLNMKPNRQERLATKGYVYKTDALLKKMESIRERGDFRFAAGKIATPKELAAFLYKVSFITARRETDSGIVRKYFEENRYLSSQLADFGFDWEVHPAYRWALQPDDHLGIYRGVGLTADD